MKLFIVVTLSIIRIIAIFGETANLRLDKDLPGGGSETQMLNRASQDAENIESIIGSGGRRSKRSCCGADGGFGSVKFSESSDPREDVISPDKVETTDGRSKKSCCDADGGFGSIKFSKSSDPREDVISPEKVETTDGRGEGD